MKLWNHKEKRPIELSDVYRRSKGAARVDSLRGTLKGTNYELQTVREILPMGSMITTSMLSSVTDGVIRGIAACSNTVFRPEGYPVVIRKVNLVAGDPDTPQLHDVDKTDAERLAAAIQAVAVNEIELQQEPPTNAFLELITQVRLKEIEEFNYNDSATVASN